jgi:hypothetical protein
MIGKGSRIRHKTLHTPGVVVDAGYDRDQRFIYVVQYNNMPMLLGEFADNIEELPNDQSPS